MSNTGKDLYKLHADNLDGLTVFQEPWWLDAVTAGSWDVVVLETNGKMEAALPYAYKTILGRRLICQPALTQHTGPWVKENSKSSASKRLAREHRLLGKLFDDLPPYWHLSMAWASPRGNWLPLFWRGFSQTTYYTYRLTDLSCTDRIFENMDYRVRRQINKARERESLTVSVSSDGEFEGLYELHKVVYLRQGRKPPHAREFLLQLDRACRERDRRRIFTARDREGRCHAAAYIVRDRDCAYYLYSGSDPDLRQSGALSLCLWSAIQYFSKDTRFFDFEGSMVPSIERHFRGFGAEQVPYFRISRSNSIIASLVERLRSQRNLRRRMAASPGT